MILKLNYFFIDRKSHTPSNVLYIFFLNLTLSLFHFSWVFFFIWVEFCRFPLCKYKMKKINKNNDDMAIIAIDTELNPYHSHKLHHHKNINNFPTWYQPCVTSFWKHHVIWLLFIQSNFSFCTILWHCIYCCVAIAYLYAVWSYTVTLPSDTDFTTLSLHECVI